MGTAGSVAVQRFPEELSKPADGSDFRPSPVRALSDCVHAARREAARYQSELFKLAREGSSSSSSPAPDVFAEARAALYDDAAAPEENLRSCVAFIVHMRKLLRLESNRTRRRRLSGHGRRLFAQQFSASNLLTDSSSGDDGDDDDIGDEDIGDGDGGDDDRKK